MSNKNIEKRLRNEIEKMTPDVLDNILLSCEDKESVKMNEEFETSSAIKRKRFNPFISMAVSAALIVLVAVLGFNGYNTLYKADSIIEFDVNPSIELKVNEKERIIQARALNEDGKKILKGMDLRKSDLDVGVNAIIGAMYKEGYISDIKNSVLVSVDNKDKGKSARMQEEISKKINDILSGYSVESSVITQDLDNSSKVKADAKKNGISKGKAEFIEKIIDEGLTNKSGKRYTFDTLSKMSINELNVILDTKNKTVKNTKSRGKASTKGYIGTGEAKRIALNNAGVSASSARGMEVELDYDYGKMIYEVSFETSRGEYEYDIDAKTGSIIKKEIEEDEDDDDYRGSSSSRSVASSSSNSKTRSSSKTKVKSASRKTTSSASYIGTSRARSIALSNAGVSAGSAKGVEVDFDHENGRAVYEVSFKSSGKEYDYDIDAKTGRIIHRSVEIDD